MATAKQKDGKRDEGLCHRTMAPGLAWKALPLVGRHVSRKHRIALFPDEPDAGRSVGTEDQAEQPGYPVVVLLAVLHVGKLGAIGAALEATLQAATSDSTPLGFLVGTTARTTILQILAAGAAVQAAGSNQILVSDDFTHEAPARNIAAGTRLEKKNAAMPAGVDDAARGSYS
jgi:hypothetical protein